MKSASHDDVNLVDKIVMTKVHMCVDNCLLSSVVDMASCSAASYLANSGPSGVSITSTNFNC